MPPKRKGKNSTRRKRNNEKDNTKQEEVPETSNSAQEQFSDIFKRQSEESRKKEMAEIGNSCMICSRESIPLS